jgi:peroxisomal membrane protein 4
MMANQRYDKSYNGNFLSSTVDGPFAAGRGVPTSIAGHPERPYHALVAGSLGGYFVWGRYSRINHQIILYLTSRVLLGLSKRAWERYYNSSHTNSKILQHPRAYSLFSAGIWGIVMILFEESPHVLHRSLKQSMDEIYRYQLSSSSSNSLV